MIFGKNLTNNKTFRQTRLNLDNIDMRNVKTRNEILEKLWARWVSQYHWNIEDLNRLFRNRHDGQLDNRQDLDYYTMIQTSIREIRVLEMQMAVSNIDWNVINREHPKKYAKRLINIKYRNYA